VVALDMSFMPFRKKSDLNNIERFLKVSFCQNIHYFVIGYEFIVDIEVRFTNLFDVYNKWYAIDVKESFLY